MTIFVAGAGGMIQAARAMRQQQRQLERMMATRAAMRAARRTAHAVEDTWQGPTHTDFACYHLCETCGFVSARVDVSCPGCGHKAWLDLSNLHLADALRDMEAEARLEPTRTSRVLSWSLCLTLLALLWWALSAMRSEVLISVELQTTVQILSTIAAVVGGVLLPKPITWLMSRDPERTRTPLRWHRPVLHDDAEVADVERGHAEVADGAKLVRAPASGRPCLAWQICVLFDTPGDARPPEWVLDETQATDVQVAGRRVEAGRVLPHDLELEPIDASRLAPDFDLVRFLRERGLHATDGEFELFEAILAPGAAVEATFHADAAAPVVFAALPQDALAEPLAPRLDAAPAAVVESDHVVEVQEEEEEEEEMGA